MHKYAYTKQFSNPVSGKLPPEVDSFLQDMAQWSGLIDYGDIIEFGNKAKPIDIKLLKQIIRRFDPAGDESDMKAIASEVLKIMNPTKQFSKSSDEFCSKCREIASNFGYPRADCNGLAMAFGNESKAVSILYENYSSSAGIIVTLTVVTHGKSARYSGLPLNPKNLLSIIKG